jgi:dienelactone hydrolase
MRRLIATVLACVIGTTLDAAVQTKTVHYKDGDQACVGFLAWDDAVRGPRPGVLVVHEWWGLDDYARGRAKQLAELGYIAFAADMYGDGKTVDHPKDAGEMAGKVRANVQAWRKRAQAGLAILKADPNCDAKKLAAIGYCFGGSTALQLAYSGNDLKAVATFHAALPAPSPDEAKQIKPRILVCNGADDTFIPATAIASFREALDKAGVKYEFVNLPGAVHSFSVPGADAHNVPGLKYNKSADEASWKKMKDLFATTLGK